MLKQMRQPPQRIVLQTQPMRGQMQKPQPSMQPLPKRIVLQTQPMREPMPRSMQPTVLLTLPVAWVRRPVTT